MYSVCGLRSVFHHAQLTRRAAHHQPSDAEVGDGCEKDEAARGEGSQHRKIKHDEDNSIWIIGAGGALLAG